ncbi:MAG TPA: sensor domain-containing diguanylate cyclase [Gaiellales bacterium]|nr:sensor domain-containing diguanylate cyclase [Gaiellales bacterium]
MSPRRPSHRRDRRELEVLHRVAVALSQSLAFSDVMDALARELVHAIDRVSECTITIWHPDRDVLEVASVYVRDAGASEDDRGDIYLLDDYPASRVVLRAADGYGVQRMTDPNIAPSVREKLIEWGWRTWIELPLVVNGSSVGLIEMADYTSARRWSQRDIDFCRTLAAQAAMAVRNAQLYEDLRNRVDKDSLTGVLNHRAFYERLEQELARAGRAGTHVAVIVVDLDDFKSLNDTRGHAAGDTALRQVAAAIRSTCRAVDIPGRLGGDEFALILPDVDTDLDALAARLLEAITAQAGQHASVGIAVAREPGASADRTVARADRSLLEAKAAGKHTYRVAA